MAIQEVKDLKAETGRRLDVLEKRVAALEQAKAPAGPSASQSATSKTFESSSPQTPPPTTTPRTSSPRAQEDH